MLGIYRPVQLLIQTKKHYKEFNNTNINKFITNKNALKNTPNYVFIPFSDWCSIVPCENDNIYYDVQNVCCVAAVGTWSYTKNIYNFDNIFIDKLTDTITDKNIPIDVLKRLPEYCCYINIENSPIEYAGHKIFGFFVLFIQNDENCCLCFYCLAENDGMFGVFLNVEENTTIKDQITKMPRVTSDGVIEHFPIKTDEHVKRKTIFMQKLLSIVLYLCSDKPDICNPLSPGTSPHRPEPKKVKGGMKLFPAQKPTIWEVGSNIGQALRNAASQREYQGGTHASPKAHIRRGHWHGYWTGPRAGNRKFVLKWLHPMLINLTMDAAE